MNKLEYTALFILAMLVVATISYGFALMGEPQSAWLWSLLGFEVSK